MGWGRRCVEKGLKETESGIRCVDNFQGRGRERTEEITPDLKRDIADLAEPHTQADPAVKTSLIYTRITAEAMRKALIEEKGYTDDELPCQNTVGNILNRMGYRLKRVLKTEPVKKIPEVDEIFENVWEVNRKSDNSSDFLCISIDVKVGEFSRNGKSREKKAGADHDMDSEAKLSTYRILNVLSGLSSFLGLRLKQVIS